MHFKCDLKIGLAYKKQRGIGQPYLEVVQFDPANSNPDSLVILNSPLFQTTLQSFTITYFKLLLFLAIFHFP